MIWKDIPGFEGLYEVSISGKVKNSITKRLLKNNNRGRYYSVTLYKNHKPHQLSVHRIVALTFIPNPENKPMVNHKNGNRYDNNIVNLEWCTQSENEKHKYEVLGYINHFKGKKHSEVSKQKMREWFKNNLRLGAKAPCHKSIRCIETNKCYETIREACRELGLQESNVSKVLKGQRKTTGGYSFEIMVEEVK